MRPTIRNSCGEKVSDSKVSLFCSIACSLAIAVNEHAEVMLRECCFIGDIIGKYEIENENDFMANS